MQRIGESDDDAGESADDDYKDLINEYRQRHDKGIGKLRVSDDHYRD